MQFFSRLTAFLISVIMTVFPCLDYSPESDDIRLNAAIISDTHIDTRLPCGKYLLERAFLDMNGCSVPTDAVIVTGDLTNYGDDASVEDFFRPYYSYVINGYKFIVICDESEDRWDTYEIYDEQIAWLDRELADGTKGGLPAFVICHEPYDGINGQPIVWEGGTMDEESGRKVKATLQKYDNVFYISGHMHEGINGELTRRVLGFCCVETVDGVNCITLPTYLIVNRYGLPGNGLGFQMEVYSDRVVFRARNFITSKWYTPYEFTIDLV